jgi:hypothetical protein
VIGNLAARMAGSKAPMNPMVRAQMMPVTSKAGVTLNANATWLNVWKFIVLVW